MIKISILVLVALVIGFLQENLKVSVNYLLETGDRIPTFFQQDSNTKQVWLEQVKVNAPFDYYHNHKRIDWLNQLSRENLVRLKWVITLLFVVAFMFINAWLIMWWTNERLYFKWTLRLYLFFFILSFAIYVGGLLTGTLPQAYGVSRKLVGGLQSLVPLMILLPASWLLRNQSKK